MYLAVAGLSCSTWDLPWVMQDLLLDVTVSTVSPSICHEVMGPDAMILVF